MSKTTLGMVAEFPDAGALLHAAARTAEAGYKKFDCHSPFPIHGMDEAMKLKRSPLGWMVGIMALSGAAAALALQGWTSVIDYPLIISGKPFFSYQAFVPVTFGLAVLAGALTSVLGMIALNRLPHFHHPVFYSDSFSRVTKDGFFISLDCTDPKFDLENTRSFLQAIGADRVELIFSEQEQQ
jgi:hypothetical protein